MNKRYIHIAVLGALLASGQVGAVEFDGFLTAGMAVHDQKATYPGGADADISYLDGITKNVSFDNDSKFGLQVNAEVSENMQAVAQILARGSEDNYAMDIAWAYLDYRLANNLNLRGGKVKEPVFLISDYFEVGYAYPWIRPPQEVYRNNPINTINGLQLLYAANLGGVNFLLQPYLGSNTDDVPGTGGQAQFLAEKFYGAAMQLSNSSFTFQVSYLKTDVATQGFVPIVDGVNSNVGGGSVDCTVSAPDGVPDAPFNGVPSAMCLMSVASEGTATLASAGLSWDIVNFVGYTEYVTRDITDSSEALFPDQDAYYVTLGYRIGKILPHITFAHSEATPLSPATAPLANVFAVSQDSVTVGLRYELNDSAALKIEYETIDLPTQGSADRPPGSNGLYSDALTSFGVMPEDKSALFSVAIDVIF